MKPHVKYNGRMGLMEIIDISYGDVNWINLFIIVLNDSELTTSSKSLLLYILKSVKLSMWKILSL
jgi:hypothetical protein